MRCGPAQTAPGRALFRAEAKIGIAELALERVAGLARIVVAGAAAQCRAGTGCRLFRLLAAEGVVELLQHLVAAVEVDNHGFVDPHDFG